MIPELFHIGSFSVSPFGLMLVLAFMAAYWQLRRGMGRLKVGTEDDASAIVLAGGIGGILGAKAYYALLYQDWRLLLSRSGLVWYGGFLLATAAVVWVMRRRRLPTWPILDAATVALALGYGIGRIGCFLVGD
ncbi:MAG: prolipoprotein diacylglyceryl transferase, partial [Acidobacteria bacterium]|nr:prolipoprotein diacylglyceryl transferase [Acidobacteriota bacterium]